MNHDNLNRKKRDNCSKLRIRDMRNFAPGLKTTPFRLKFRKIRKRALDQNFTQFGKG